MSPQTSDTHLRIRTNTKCTFADLTAICRVLEIYDLLHQLVVAEFAHCRHNLGTLKKNEALVLHYIVLYVIHYSIFLLTYLWVHKPAVVERNVKQIKDDAFRRVLEIRHTCKTHINVEACRQLWQHSHRVAHVLRRQ